MNSESFIFRAFPAEHPLARTAFLAEKTRNRAVFEIRSDFEAALIYSASAGLSQLNPLDRGGACFPLAVNGFTMPVMAKKELHLGTCSFTAEGWIGKFYPDDWPSDRFLKYYATRFNAVEIDSTFYRTPAPRTVQKWVSSTPRGFSISCKAPQVITHEKVLVDCEREVKNFLIVMAGMGERLGPILFQFPYFNQKAFKKADEFLERLAPFLAALPKEFRYAVEIRNQRWLSDRLFDLLREHHVALALIDHPWMPVPAELFSRYDPITADFTYVRWLGDRKAIEEVTTVWDRTVLERTVEMGVWVDACRDLHAQGIEIFAFANNHYSGYAPETIELFQKLWKAKS